MLTVNFYTFTKKTNSTARPTGTAALTASCLLKDVTSIITPVIELRTANPIAYNYCYIADFNRYYFIDDIVWDAGVWSISLHCDVLATYKTVIGTTNGYVLRAANKSNGEIVDSLYPTTAVTTVTAVQPSATSTFTGATNFQSGYYVIGVQGIGQASDNGVIYYQLTPTKFTLLLHSFYANSGQGTWWGNLERGVINVLNNISDFIVTCRWYPKSFIVDYGIDDSGPQPVQGDGYEIYLGAFNTLVKAPRVIGNATYMVNYDDIPKHPQAAYGNYTKIMPFTCYELVDPLIGTLTLNPVVMKNDTAVTCYLNYDYVSGELKYTVTGNNTSYPFYTTFLKGGIDISLSGNDVNVSGLASKARTTLGSLMSGDMLGVAAGIGSTLTDLMPEPAHNESTGSIITIKHYSPFIRCLFKQIVNRDVTNKGLPLCEWNNPATLQGYMIIDDPHVATTGTSQETDQVNSYLASGFYYE